MDVAEFFDAFVVGEDVEVVVARLPEGALDTAQSYREFQSFDCVG